MKNLNCQNRYQDFWDALLVIRTGDARIGARRRRRSTSRESIRIAPRQNREDIEHG